MERIDEIGFYPLLLLPETGQFADKAAEMNIETHFLPSLIKHGEAHRLHKLPRMTSAIFGLKKIIRERNVRILHSNTPRAAFIGGLAARMAGIPSVVHVRDIYLSPFSHPLKAWLLNVLSDVIVAVSSATRESIVASSRVPKDKVRVVYNGVDVESLVHRSYMDMRKQFSVQKDAPLIGCFGLLDPAKGQEVLIEAAALIKETLPSLRALIVGDTLLEKQRNYQKKLVNLATEMGLSETIIFTGFRNDVFDIMKALDVLVHPAIYPEPFPRTLLEASALERAIVATRTGGIPELLDDGVSSLLVPPSDPAALARAVLLLLKDRDKARTLAVSARKKVEDNFSLDRHVEGITRIYRELLD
jgi:glycosyltransferase involved in cell wall biosynthesis